MSLRDALLKAGKVSKKQAQQARTEKRKKRKKKGGGHRVEAQANAESLARDAERRLEQRAADKARAEETRLEREAQERRMRINNLIQAWKRRPGRNPRRAWHFVRSNGRIGRIRVDGETAAALEYGTAAIVEPPENESAPEIVAAEGVRKLIDLHPKGIRFYVGTGAPKDPLTCPPRNPKP